MPSILIIAGPHKGEVYSGPLMGGRSFQLSIRQEHPIGQWDPYPDPCGPVAHLQLYKAHEIAYTRSGKTYFVAIPHDDYRDAATVAFEFVFEKALKQ